MAADANPLPERRSPALRLDIVTLFPEACQGYLDSSIVGRARRRGLVDIELVDPRRWAGGRHRKVDDRPFGGGPGMVLAAPPVAAAIALARKRTPGPVILLTPRGETFGQGAARRLAAGPGFTLICGRYEGLDERIHALVDLELSVGDVVQTP